ncbi:GNAT family N-acetyltransferase [Herbidospora solisilvae]|uniref:GNAT family N-acetyltransferase n=1 Tax=Herbidospora solisilvae TaxID=2696284 RepID=UPI00192A0DBB|nr:GNAT family N-acetyltransferase [Herbidospora solisilvae]
MRIDTLNLSAELVLRRADGTDLPDVLTLLADTARWLDGLGVRQWPSGGFPAARITPLIDEGVLYVLTVGDETAAVMALDDHADAEFWTPADRPESAFYVHKLAVNRAHSGRGLGEVLLDWAGLRALAAGRRHVRLDCSKENLRLQGYYLGQRFRHVRTVDLPHRASGALFERPAGLRGGRTEVKVRDLTAAGKVLLTH